MEIKVFQLNHMEFAIMQIEFMIQEKVTINSNPYITMYEYKEEEEGKSDFIILNEAWDKFNRDDRPNGHKMRSLSISDVVQVGDRFYLCTMFGWKKVAFEGRETVQVKSL